MVDWWRSSCRPLNQNLLEVVCLCGTFYRRRPETCKEICQKFPGRIVANVGDRAMFVRLLVVQNRGMDMRCVLEYNLGPQYSTCARHTRQLSSKG